MYVPYEAGCILVRDAQAHRSAFTLTPPYLASFERGTLANAPFMADYGPELSRSFRALKIWMLLKEHGTARYARLIARNVAQTKQLAEFVDREPRLERLSDPELNIVGLRYVGPRGRALELDALNKELLMRVQESGVAVPSSTVLRGHFALRVCIVNHRTQDEDLELFVAECVRLGNQLVEEGKFDEAH
jgi:glutamate/tyrosine decarboxylase-like PLP-dependent enzyme